MGIALRRILRWLLWIIWLLWWQVVVLRVLLLRRISWVRWAHHHVGSVSSDYSNLWLRYLRLSDDESVGSSSSADKHDAQGKKDHAEHIANNCSSRTCTTAVARVITSLLVCIAILQVSWIVCIVGSPTAITGNTLGIRRTSLVVISGHLNIINLQSSFHF